VTPNDIIAQKRQQAAQSAKEQRDRVELARMVVNSLTDRGIRVIAELDTTRLSELESKSYDQLKKLNQELIQAVKAIDTSPIVTVEAPVVDIPAPIVHVEAQKAPIVTNKVDLSPLQATLQELLAPKEVKIDLSRYRAQDIKESGDKQYVGFVNPEGDWYIIENDMTKNRLRYLFGSSGYAKHFKNASSYVYKLLDKAVKDAS
jgi:hypothetical protein